MKKAYLLLVLTSLLFGSCKKQEENKKEEEEEKPQVELPKNMQKKSSENLSESTIEDVSKDGDSANQSYISSNFYGNNIDEYLSINEGNYFYWTSERKTKIKLEVFDVKENVVEKVSLVITGKMKFPNDTKVYAFTQYESGIIIAHPDGKTQEYKWQN